MHHSPSRIHLHTRSATSRIMSVSLNTGSRLEEEREVGVRSVALAVRGGFEQCAGGVERGRTSELRERAPDEEGIPASIAAWRQALSILLSQQRALGAPCTYATG